MPSNAPIRRSADRDNDAFAWLIAASRHLRMLTRHHDEQTRADYQAYWRAAYFEVMGLMRPGDRVAVDGHVFTRVDDRLLVVTLRKERRAS